MWYFFLKRVVDITLSFFGILVLSPLFLIIAMAVKCSSSGPIFADIPERVGKNRKVFKMYKFRSMIENAHEELRRNPKYREFYNLYQKGNFKIKTDQDPRITAVGKFLRKTSLDELPQVLNVLKGEMSLVGPRAFHVDELEAQLKNFPETKKLVKEFLGIKPGITGPWQVSGRSSIDFPQRVAIDAQYAKNRSIFYDLMLMLKTIPAVTRGEGS